MVQLIDKHKDTKHSKIDPEEFTDSGLGGKIGNTLIRVFKKLTNGLTDWFEERLINFAIGVLVKVEKSGATVFGSLIKELKDKKAIPDFLKPIFDEIEDPKHEIGAMLSTQVGGTAIGGLFGAIFDPLMASVKYTLQQAIKPYYPDVNQAVLGRLFGVLDKTLSDDIIKMNGFRSEWSSLFTKIYKNKIPYNELVQLKLRGEITESLFDQGLKDLALDDTDIKLLKPLMYRIPDLAGSVVSYFRGSITEGKLKEIADQNGVPQEFLDIIICSNRRLLDIGDLRAVYFRTGKDEVWLTGKLAKLGYDSESVKDLIDVFTFFPQVPDLIRFAVREVYTPDIVEKYGQMEDLPPKFLEEAKKAGLPEEQAKNFWGAHWELPSVMMGYEMMHRGVITEEELTVLLRTLDVMPYWRDKLIQISYNPLTRVDVRRMFNLGVLSEDEVFKAYKDIGYNAENARRMTDFTKLFGQSAEKNLSKADILAGYERKYFSYDDTLSYLKLLGYDQLESEYYMSKVDYKEEKANKKMMIDLYADMYKKGVVDDNTAIQDLSKFGVTTAEINYYLSKWTIAKVGKSTLPSKDDLKNWVKGKIITREDFILEMSNLGYAIKYIDNYLKELKK